MRGKMKRLVIAALLAVCCAAVLGGCQNPEEPSSQSISQSRSITSSSPSRSGMPPSSHQSSSSFQSSQSSPSTSSLSSSASEETSSQAGQVSSQPEELQAASTSSEPGGGTDVPSVPESQEPSLWQLADIAFEKRVYGAESARIYFRLTNKSEDVMYIMRDYDIEKMENGVWVPIEGNHRLDSQTIQYAVEPGTSRLVGVPVDWLWEPNERYGDDRIPEGMYRLRIYINQHYWRTVPFEIQEDPLEQDTSLYEIHTLNEVYLTVSESVNYEVINKTDQDLSFSYRCYLERLEGDVWKRFEGSGGPDFIIIVGPNSIMRETFSLEPFRPLEPGEYRLVKTLARNTYYAPFTLAETLEQKDTEPAPPEEDPIESLPETEPPQEKNPQSEVMNDFQSSQEPPLESGSSSTSSQAEQLPEKTGESSNAEASSSSAASESGK